MLLAVDVGNTNITVGVFSQSKLTRKWRISTESNKTGDEYEILFHSFLDRFGIKLKEIKQLIFSSVVPRLSKPLLEMFHTLLGITPVVLNEACYDRLPIRVIPPGVGADLAADAVAAWQRYQKPCIIVDFGTALTVTSVSGQGELLGVAIAPGLLTAMKSLTENTAQLPPVELKPPASVIGTDTVSSLQAGLVLGYKGLVESLVDRTKEEFKEKNVIVAATGGMVNVLSSLTNRFDEVVPHLTLEGLEICFRFLGKVSP